MSHHRRDSSPAASPSSAPHEIEADSLWPFGRIPGLENDEIRETAYEVFFTACRSSPGFGGGRNPLSYHSADDGGSPRNGVGMATVSRVKRALGLKTLKKSPSRRTVSLGSGPGSGSGSGSGSAPSSPSANSQGVAFTVPPAKFRRPLTSAEIMRQQMRVTEQSDNRLRKTLLRTLVGQTGRRAETIILPLELLRHVRPSEFNDMREYHIWQRRQLKVLEAGLPGDKYSPPAVKLREITRAAETKPLDTVKNSEPMRILCNSVVSLAWGTPSTSESCHWADTSPLNLNLYAALLRSIFDHSLVLDEVDELLELMKKTWSTLGMNRSTHNLCFAIVLFQQYIATGQTELDLLNATHVMLGEIAVDSKKPDKEHNPKMLTSALNSIAQWTERKLLNYQTAFDKTSTPAMDIHLRLAVAAGKIQLSHPSAVDDYIRTSLTAAFEKLLNRNPELSLIKLAKETEELSSREIEIFTPLLKKFHPNPGGIAAVVLHRTFGGVLKQYLASIDNSLTNETIAILQRAGDLEKTLVQMVVDDSADSEDGGKSIIKQMMPYEIDGIISKLLRSWVDERLRKAREFFIRSQETETWNPKSKTEAYAQSAVELIKLAEGGVSNLLEIPIPISKSIAQDMADGLENVFRDYTVFAASCGTKQNYIPALPPLTRCNRDSKFIKLWKKASPCSVGIDDHSNGSSDGHHPRPSTSRGTQRLYIRLNTLHYILSHLQSLDKTLALSPKIIPTRFSRSRQHLGPSSPIYFDLAISSIQAACQHVSEVAAYRLIFLDSNTVFYDSLYLFDVANSRIRPAIRILKQNLALLCSIVTDQAQPLAIKEVMKASFEACLMVLLAGGNSRVFCRSDHCMIEQDFESLKRVFCSCGEGLIAEEVVERESETMKGIIALMGQSTEQLMDDFSILACEASGIGVSAAVQKLPMPPTTGRWNRSDPNTILRVLCYRNDGLANQFLKRTFQLAKRR